MRKTMLALLAFAFFAAPGARAETEAEIVADLSEDGKHSVVVTQTWSGAEALRFRQSLDVLFGDIDGALSDEELDKISSATEKDMEAEPFPRMVVDGVAPPMTDVTVEFEDATGPIAAPGPLKLRHVLHLDGQPLGEGEHTLRISPLVNGTASVSLPAGWNFTSAEGASVDETAEGAAATLELAAGEDATLSFSEAAPPPAVDPPPSDAPDVVDAPPVDAGGSDPGASTETEAPPAPVPDAGASASAGRRELPLSAWTLVVAFAAAAAMAGRRTRG